MIREKGMTLERGDDVHQKIKDAYNDPLIVKLDIHFDLETDNDLCEAVIALVVDTFATRHWRSLHFWSDSWGSLCGLFRQRIEENADLDRSMVGGTDGHGGLDFIGTPIVDAGMTEIHYAARDGNLEKVLQIVSRENFDRESLDAKSTHIGWTPLHLAAINGHQAVVEVLVLKSHCELNTTNNFGNSPLCDVLLKGKTNFARFLVEHGAEVRPLITQQIHKPADDFGFHYFMPDKASLLHYAVARGHYEAVEILLENGMDPNIQTDSPDKLTPLAMISRNYGDSDDRIKCARLLLERGANANESGPHGDTPFSSACEYYRLEEVKLYLEYNADLQSHSERDQSTPLHFACQNRCGRPNLEVIKVFVEAAETKEQYNSLKIINARDAESRTPLHLACAAHYDNVEAAQYLLDHGADVHSVDAKGRTPLHIAMEAKGYKWCGCVRLIQVLVGAGADVRALDSDGKTPLHRGASHPAMVEALVALLGEDSDTLIQSVDRNGNTLLHQAIVHPDVMEFLMARCKRILTIANHDGNLPLHIAVASGMRPHTLELMIESYPEALSSANANGWLPLHQALHRDFDVEQDDAPHIIDLVKLLVRYYPGGTLEHG